MLLTAGIATCQAILCLFQFAKYNFDLRGFNNHLRESLPKIYDRCKWLIITIAAKVSSITR